MMDYIYLTTVSKRSLYLQLEDCIRKAILSNQLKHLERLPTEQELCSFFRISATVVKRAYKQLSDESIIVRIKGKGTFVQQRPTAAVEMPLFSTNLPSESTIVKKFLLIDRLSADPQAYPKLGLVAGEKCFLVKRMIKVHGYPFMLQVIYLPTNLFPKLEKNIADNIELKDLITLQYNLKIAKVKSTYSATNVHENNALILGLDVGAPVHFIKTSIMSPEGKMLAYMLSYLPGEYISMGVDLL
jgi:GntR family transcriptional regulator